MDLEADAGRAGNQKGDGSVIFLQRGKCLLWKMCIEENHRVLKMRVRARQQGLCRESRKELWASGCRDPTACLPFSLAHFVVSSIRHQSIPITSCLKVV